MWLYKYNMANTDARSHMVSAMMLPYKKLSLSKMSKEELAAYISTHHSGRNIQYAWPLTPNSDASLVMGYPEWPKNGAYVIKNNGSIWATMRSDESHSRVVTRQTNQPGRIKPNLINALFQLNPFSNNQENNQPPPKMSYSNRVKMYHTLMKQDRIDLLKLARIVHGYHNEMDAMVGVTTLATPAVGKHWGAIKKLAKTLKVYKNVFGGMEKYDEVRYRPGHSGAEAARKHFETAAALQSRNTRNTNRSPPKSRSRSPRRSSW
jgi:hypothetical protein